MDLESQANMPGKNAFRRTDTVLGILRRWSVVDLSRANVAVPGELLDLFDSRPVFKGVRDRGLA
jgi:hypothetical protein